MDPAGPARRPVGGGCGRHRADPTRPAGSRDAVATGFALPAGQVRPAFEDPLAALAAAVRLPAGDPEAAATWTGDTAAARDRAAGRARRRRSPSRPPTCCRCTGCPTTPAGPARTGGCAAAASCSAPVIRRPGCGCRWTRSPGIRSPSSPTPIRSPRPRRPAHTAVPDPGLAVVVPAIDAPTTAVVVEVRDGFVYVFLPPLVRFDDFVELVGVVEQAAAVTGTPVVVEGYGPPGDAALQTLTVTPDPGVIEVNVQPTRTWAEQVRARDHAVRGRPGRADWAPRPSPSTAPTPAPAAATTSPSAASPRRESPLLRRPDLLVSLLTYWQRHPSLSYLFSGRFIGPTSQAPRVDEGRAESLYELEIAFAEIDRLTREAADRDPEDTAPDTGSTAGAASPWVVDRALRHLLTDVTGNTHRSEFCIDKLYSPDSARGPARAAGAARLRDAAAPPDGAGAGAAGAGAGGPVLGRAAAGAADPARTGPARALPVAALRDRRHRRGRRPICARTASNSRPAGWTRSWSSASRGWAARLSPGSTSSCASAIEPWHVLGEEATAGGTARYVDSSVERMQVLLDGADPARHLLTVNGVPVPLTPTGEAGRSRRRRPLPGLAAVECAAPDHPGAVAAGLRPGRRRPPGSASAAAPITWCTPAAGPTTRHP